MRTRVFLSCSGESAEITSSLGFPVSFPAGAARVPLGRFTLYTFLGSYLWSLSLAYVGVFFGENWTRIRGVWQGFDLAVLIGLVALFLLWLRSHLRSSRTSRPSR